MQLTNNTILVTGGSSGIGMALAKRFLELGNEVIVTGRSEKALQELKAQHPGMNVKVSDAGSASARVELAAEIVREFPKLNMLVNNAGIQRKVSIPTNESWEETEREININLAAPVHLSSLFVPHLRRRPDSFIVNVSSGLAFVPMSPMPIYCATKAALHSFTLSLRSQLKSQSIGVVEIIPPAVKTNLGGSHDFGEDLAEFTEGVIAQLKAGAPEITFGMSTKWSQLSRAESDSVFQQFNNGKQH
jgi:uncharacterized oxidoreductase